MATLNEIIARAEALRKESYVNSIDPERVGSIMSDTLKYLNEFQLQSGSMGLDKIYASVSAMNSDNAPVSDLTGKPLKAGQLAVIVASGEEDEDNGKVYRFDNPGWTYVSIIGNLNIVQKTGNSETAVMSQKAVTDYLNAGYLYKGIANPSTDPGTPDQNVFYIATQSGTYTNFNSLEINESSILSNASGQWTSSPLGIPSSGTLDSLKQEVGANTDFLFGADFSSGALPVITGSTASFRIDNSYLKKGQKVSSAIISNDGGVGSRQTFGYINAESEIVLNVLTTSQGEYAEYTLPEDIIAWLGYLNAVPTGGTFEMVMTAESFEDSIIEQVAANTALIEDNTSLLTSIDEQINGFSENYSDRAIRAGNAVNITKPNILTSGNSISVTITETTNPIVIYLLREDSTYIEIGRFSSAGSLNYVLKENFRTLRLYSANGTTFSGSVSIIIENEVVNYESLQSVRIFQRVGCIGDSYMAGYIQLQGQAAHGSNPNYSWPHYMEKITGNVFTNFAQSGSTAKQWVSGAARLDEVQAPGNKCQAYVIALMINDQGDWTSWATPVGTKSDIGTDADTYYAWYYKLVQEVIKVNSQAKIFCMTCFVYEPSYSYNQAVRDIVDYCQDAGQNVYLCDTAQYRNSSFFQNPIFSSDRLSGHYTAIGYELMAEFHTRLLSDVINANVEEFQNVFEIEFDS